MKNRTDGFRITDYLVFTAITIAAILLCIYVGSVMLPLKETVRCLLNAISGAPQDEVKLAADEYYACGDNSPNSFDSRYWGPVPAKNLCGIAGGVFWPIVNPRWGRIE